MIDLIGRKFGRLSVIKRVDNNKWGNLCWLCRCSCGQEKIVVGRNLKSGNTQSCGCLQKENRIKHGHSNSNRGKASTTYESWHQMIQRCTNPNRSKYKYYGGRGITVCGRWKRFSNFLVDMGEKPTKNHSIDRKNNDGNYCKSNCRWATTKQQARNTSRNHLVQFNGKTQCIADWSEETGIQYNTIRLRLKRGWSIQKALTTISVRKIRK